MKDYLDYMALWLPVAAFIVAMLLMGLIIRRNDDRLAGFERFVRIFLEQGATLKTWGLFLSSLTLILVLSSVIGVIASDASWAQKIPNEIQLDRIVFLRTVAIGLLVQVSIVLGAFGAVAFKGQLPGGASFALNQDPAGNQTMAASGPAPVAPQMPIPPKAPEGGG